MEYKPLNEGLFERTLKEIYDSGKREIAVTVHASSPLCDYVTPENEKSYLENNRIFLEECKERKIPIIHLISSDYTPVTRFDSLGKFERIRADNSKCPKGCTRKCENKPSKLEKIFGVKADYEISTLCNTGMPVDTKLLENYIYLKASYNSYLPHSYSVFNRAIMTGLYANKCVFEASSIIAPHAEELVIIAPCTLEIGNGDIDRKKYHSEIVTSGYNFPSFKSLGDFLNEKTHELFDSEQITVTSSH